MLKSDFTIIPYFLTLGLCFLHAVFTKRNMFVRTTSAEEGLLGTQGTAVSIS